MDIEMGSQTFTEVAIPLLWGSRAVLQDRESRLSVIDLGGDLARPEIVGDEPAPGVEFLPTIDGFTILSHGRPMYSFSRTEKTLTGIGLNLPPCQILPDRIVVGSNVFAGNHIAGFGVGIAVTEQGISISTRLPPNLARLAI